MTCTPINHFYPQLRTPQKIHLIIGLQHQKMYCKDCNAFRYFSMTKIKGGLINYVQQHKYYQTKASEFQG